MMTFFRVVINKEDDVQIWTSKIALVWMNLLPSASTFCRHPLLHFSCENAWSRLTDFSRVMSKSLINEKLVYIESLWKKPSHLRFSGRASAKKLIKLSICHHLCVFGACFITHGNYLSVGLFSSGVSISFPTWSKFVMAGPYHNYTSHRLQRFFKKIILGGKFFCIMPPMTQNPKFKNYYYYYYYFQIILL